MSDEATRDDDIKINIVTERSLSLYATENSLEAPSAGSGHHRGRTSDDDGDGDDVELMPSAKPRSTDSVNGGVGLRPPRQMRRR